MKPRNQMNALVQCLMTVALGMATAGCQHAPRETTLPGSTSAVDHCVQRGLDYLAREVPLWRPENGCFSCHHNGDGAGVLYQAMQQWPAATSHLKALKETTGWLAHPSGWDHNRGEPGFSDQRLARIQFALALIEACKARVITWEEILRQATSVLLDEQGPDGSWVIEPRSALGSPTTYGTHLATALVRRALIRTGLDFEPVPQAEARARKWLIKASANNHLEAASLIIGLTAFPPETPLPGELEQGQRCLDFLLRGQSSDGGWGPYPDAPSEIFDTAVVLLALRETDESAARNRAIDQGRRYLITSQWPEGDWTETTRPAGGESYAQRVSTTAWALRALLGNSSAIAPPPPKSTIMDLEPGRAGRRSGSR